ncbi:hypothetical protein RUM43_000314 [Polyplax serrata]|uniref:Asparagine synthetase domain-containing protein n=1 Tax=Polyplax serrata TaxID=468196 RepID=A0AAN8XND3_POLSC
MTRSSDGNDTQNLWNKLQEAREKGLSIVKVFSSIRGPFSFIYYEKESRKLYFGRDVVGRHSLLIGFSQRSITISSVGSRKVDGFTEVPAIGIFCFSLEKDGETPLTLHSWSHVSDIFNVHYLLPKGSTENMQVGEVIETYLQAPRRSNKTPTTSDLEMWRVQDQDQSLGSLLQKITLSDAKTRIRQTMVALMAKSTIQIIVGDLLSTLRVRCVTAKKQAVKVRVEKQPKFCKNCTKTPETNQNCLHARLAILFSGGLDSAVLASLAHEYLPPGEPIDLLNVAFEKKEKPPEGKQNSRWLKKDVSAELSFNVPDRATGLSTLFELKTMHPDRKWNFVEINVTQDELKRERERVITHLISPLNTVLDDSLGCALWFASRGAGHLEGGNEVYISPARIVFSGIGADEQLGGYMRHRTTLKHKGGWEALDKELQYELGRISQRNLGRDDRIVSDHGRQLRMPYLDEDVINYLGFIPPWNRCYPVDSMPPGVGDKLLLRLAAWELGFRDAANLPKRAMQFGSRIANSREKASDVSDRLHI